VPATALHDALSALGARFAERAGWTVALGLGDAEREHRAVRETVGLADRSARAFTLFSGPDAVRFLQGMVTQDVAGIEVGSAAYALLLTPKARVVADLRLLRLAPDAFLADCEPSAGEPLRRTLRRYRMASKVEIQPADGQYAALTVAGPKAGVLLADAFGVLPRTEPPEGAGTEIEAGGVPVHAVSSVDYGEKAFDLVGRAEGVVAAWAALAASLPKHDGAVFGEDVREILRVEAGVPRFGAELDELVMPAEAEVVGRAVSFTKGCYIGQEPVARLHYRGHTNRVLRSLLLDGEPPAPGASVVLEGKDVGRVTSAVRSLALDRVVALGYVRREIEEGQRLEVVAGEDRRAAEVGRVPAYSWRA
jgi:folate-binding protein YgfZ